MTHANPTIRRTFMPGSEWLYYKIYTGTKTADRVLTEIILPLTTQLKDQNLIDRWFFIRYGDPDHHLRVRFHLQDQSAFSEVVSLVAPPLEKFYDLRLIWDIKINVYKREIERYGEDHIVDSEALFHLESEMITQFLSLIDGEEGEELRWLFGLRAINQLLEDFRMTDEEKINLLDALRKGFMYEFGTKKSTKIQLDNKFRQERNKIDWFLSFDRNDAPEYSALLDLLDEKSRKSVSVIGKIRRESTPTTISDLLISYIHMMMNRLFRSKNRMHELVMYYLLWKTLDTGRKRAIASGQ